MGVAYGSKEDGFAIMSRQQSSADEVKDALLEQVSGDIKQVSTKSSEFAPIPRAACCV